MISLKPGVRLNGIRPEMALAARIVEGVFESFNLMAVITSCTDGEHKKGSLHYVGAALDFRSRNIPPDKLQVLFQTIVERLGSDFDVVLESDHIHLEFDPKEKG